MSNIAAKPHKMLNNASKTKRMPLKRLKNALKREKYKKMQKMQLSSNSTP